MISLTGIQLAENDSPLEQAFSKHASHNGIWTTSKASSCTGTRRSQDCLCCYPAQKWLIAAGLSLGEDNIQLLVCL